MNSVKGLTQHADELASASYFHQGISMNSEPCDWKDAPEQLSVFYIHRKSGHILFGSSYYREAHLSLLDVDLWLQSAVLNSVDVKQSLAHVSGSRLQLNVL